MFNADHYKGMPSHSKRENLGCCRSNGRTVGDYRPGGKVEKSAQGMRTAH